MSVTPAHLSVGVEQQSCINFQTGAQGVDACIQKHSSVWVSP